jgi:hypothetical protein
MSNVNPPITTHLSESNKPAGAQSQSGLGAKIPPAVRKPLERAELTKKLSTPLLYISSSLKARRYHEAFQNIKTYCLFIGHGRSGHSIFGALLDAHPKVIIPDELDTLRYIAAGFSKDQIAYLLLAKSQTQARRGRKKMGLGGKLYSYQVPNQWQGRFDTLQIIGDSQAGVTTQRLAQNPALYQRLQETMIGVNIKVLHVVRNPFDNISTLMLRGGRSFENAIERYFTNCETIVDFRRRLNRADLLVVRQEDFLADPQTRLIETCRFLSLETNPAYLDDCATILYKSPAKSRSKLDWTPELINLVQRRISEFDFLAGYTYDL